MKIVSRICLWVIGCVLLTACTPEYNNDVKITFDDESSDYGSGMMAWYTFDNSDGSDASGNHRDAAFYGEPNFIQGKSGNGVFLNAAKEEYMNIPYALLKDWHEWTVSFWIKDFGSGNIFAAQNTIPNAYLDASYSDYPMLWAGDNGRLVLKNKPGVAHEGDGHAFSYTYTSHQADGNWHHVVVALKEKKQPYSYKTYEGIVRLYVDGTLKDQFNYTNNQDWENECSKLVFAGNKDGGYPYKSSMKLDEVRFYDKPLGTAAVSALYNHESSK